MTFKMKMHGCRGSLPSPQSPEEIINEKRTILKEFVNWSKKNGTDVDKFLNTFDRIELAGHGGNTLCVEITSTEGHLIIDCGSGLRTLGNQLCAGECGNGKGEIHFFMTHFHWDHLIGLPFFPPIYIPGNKIHFYAVQPELEEIIRLMFKKPNFPVPFEALGAEIFFHQMPGHEAFKFKDMTVTPYQLDHPDPCWGYKIGHNGKNYAHCVDTECTRASRGQLGDDLPLYQDIDLMIFDAQYSFTQYLARMNWGHANANLGLDVALREKVKRIIFLHHDPAATKAEIIKLSNETASYLKTLENHAKKRGKEFTPVEWEFAYEGMEIDI